MMQPLVTACDSGIQYDNYRQEHHATKYTAAGRRVGETITIQHNRGRGAAEV